MTLDTIHRDLLEQRMVLREALEKILKDLEEAHYEELLAHHSGDTYCSYCEDIKDAKAALKAVGRKTRPRPSRRTRRGRGQ